MSHLYAYQCDVCHETVTTVPKDSYMGSTSFPDKWHRFNGRDLCSLRCVEKYAHDPALYPAQKIEKLRFDLSLTEGISELHRQQKAVELIRRYDVVTARAARQELLEGFLDEIDNVGKKAKS